jgi:hypothetical protein
LVDVFTSGRPSQREGIFEFDSPPNPHPPYRGAGWLGNVADEYKRRFAINFGKGPVPFERIQELVLARNAGVHRDEGNLKTYLKAINKPAFVDDGNRFFVTRDALVPIIQDCEQFLKWVISEIEKLSTSPKRSR